MRITNIGTIAQVDNVIAIGINKDYITRLWVSTMDIICVLSLPSVDLSLILEYAVSLHTIEVTDRLTNLNLVNLVRTLNQHITWTMNDTFTIINLSNSILVIREVEVYAISKVLTNAVVPV